MKLKWTDRYNCHSCKIGDFVVSCNWSTDRSRPGFFVRFNDVTLKDPIDDLDEAKKAALRLARLILTRSLAAMGDAGMVPNVIGDEK